MEPEAVTETRTRQLRNRSISEYLTKWKNLPTEDSTCEDKNFIQKHTELLKNIDNTFLNERSMLGPYITSIVPYCHLCNPLIVIGVPL